jgi:hypothetical protein
MARGSHFSGDSAFLLSGLMTGAFGRDVVSYFKPSARAVRLAKSDTLRDKADENEKGD